MVLGDGIRRNIGTVSQEERDRLRDAIIQLNKQLYPGTRTDTPAGGVTRWFKQDEIHARSHVHGCPAFLPWHRELVNRFEELLRTVDPQLSMHYWDWTQDPQHVSDGKGGFVNLFTSSFMGNPHGEASEPLRSNGFYNPNASPARSDLEFDPNNNPADPPLHINRDVQPGAPITTAVDQNCVFAPDFPTFDGFMQNPHAIAHGHIGGTLSDPHTSFRDPFVFLLHANVDRIFALWQLQDPDLRVDPDHVYGVWSSTKGDGDVATGFPNWGILSPLEPWAGPGAQTSATGIIGNVGPVRPWAPPENEQNLAEYQKDSKHLTVVKPPCYDTNPIVVEVAENVLHFNNVPSGETTIRAAHFRFISCVPLTLHVTSGPIAPYAVFTPGGTITAKPSDDIWTDAFLYISFTGGTPNTSAPTSTLTIHCDESKQDFTFTLAGNTIPRPTVAVVMVLDQSGSMDDPAGNVGVKRVEALREAAGLFVDVIQQDNAIGIIRFDQKAYAVNDPQFPGVAVTTIGSGGIFDPGRAAVRSAVAAHNTNPAGSTSIGAGIKLARSLLNPVIGFQDKALLVFTDGLENTSPLIADVQGDIDQRTYAIGLGNAQQVNTAALDALTNGTGGYLLLTGLLSSSTDDYFLLSKYFLQILAGVTNTYIIRDPSGFVTHSKNPVVIPFNLSEADIEATVVLLTDLPAVDFSLQTPAGDIISPANAASVKVNYSVSGSTSYYRFTLPAAIGKGAREGKWKALLRLNEGKFKELTSRVRPKFDGVRYSLIAMSWTNIRMRASISQTSFVPGCTSTLRVTLDEYSIPIDHRATVRANVTSPDGAVFTLLLTEAQPGNFEASTSLKQSGVYHFYIQAAGVTLHGNAFTREQLLTTGSFLGVDQPPVSSPQTPGGSCCLLNCLLKDKSVQTFLTNQNLDPIAIQKCVDSCCNKN